MQPWAFWMIVVSLAAAGCSGTEPETAVPVAYTEPGWMADVRIQNEEYGRAGAACLRAEGVEPSAENEFGVIYRGDPNNPDAPIPAEIQAAYDAAVAICSEQVPAPAFAANSPEVEYDRNLDVRACLIDQGYSMPEAPSREVWVEQFTAGEPWNPYYNGFADDIEAPGHHVTPGEMNRLQALCTPSMVGGITSVELGS